MRFLRFVAALVLIAALPIYGWASLVQSGACAMADSVDTCCSEAGEGKAGSSSMEPGPVDLCQAEPPCQTSGAAYLLPVIVLPPLADVSHFVNWLQSAPHLSHSPPTLWRPPRAL